MTKEENREWMNERIEMFTHGDIDDDDLDIAIELFHEKNKEINENERH